MKVKFVYMILAVLAISLSAAACQNQNTTEKAEQEQPAEDTAEVEDIDDILSSDTKADESADADNEDSSAQADENWSLNIDTVTLDGEPVKGTDFSENTLTVMNIWATWCGPCVKELPELEKIDEAFADKGVKVVGVLQDGITAAGEQDAQVIEQAKALLSDAKADYQMVLPDDTLVNEFISTMMAFPTTIFIDSEGRIIETIVGSNDFTGWSEAIEKALTDLSE